MDNISGNANYTSDQDIANGKTVRKKITKKTVKEKVKQNLESMENNKEKNPIYQKAVELHRAIEDEYNKSNQKKLYDALISAQGVVEVMRDIE